MKKLKQTLYVQGLILFIIILFIMMAKIKDLKWKYCIFDNQIRNFVDRCQHAPARITQALGFGVQRLSGGPQVAPSLPARSLNVSTPPSIENLIFMMIHSKTLGRRVRV